MHAHTNTLIPIINGLFITFAYLWVEDDEISHIEELRIQEHGLTEILLNQDFWGVYSIVINMLDCDIVESEFEFVTLLCSLSD